MLVDQRAECRGFSLLGTTFPPKCSSPIPDVSSGALNHNVFSIPDGWSDDVG